MANENLFDRNDPKWSHPGLYDEYYIDGRASVDKLLNPEKPYEKRLNSRNKAYVALEEGKKALYEEHPEYVEQGETVEYHVPGCPEEPDHEVRVTVRMPKKRRKKMPAIFYIPGGAMLYGTPLMGPIDEYCYKFNCIVVSPWYRTSLDGKYPGAVNDCHAAYKWMMDNAAELGINTDKVVISGLSAGAYLSIAFAFRLKRYGYKPRGVVALDPIFSDDQAYLSNHYISDNWDSAQMHKVMECYLGDEKVENIPNLPEALPDKATTEECEGLCPIIIHTSESDAGRDPAFTFMQALYGAGVYAEIHQWGGCCHATLNNSTPDNEQHKRFQAIVDGNIQDLLKYDMRREWLSGEPESTE